MIPIHPQLNRSASVVKHESAKDGIFKVLMQVFVIQLEH